MIKSLSKYQQATAIAIFFHFIGLTGLLFLDTPFFIRCTAFNLLLSFLLLIWTQQNSWGFLLFFCVTTTTGYFSEVAGVNTGILFGSYSYGSVLGPQWLQVPFLTGINWFIIIYCCGISTQTLLLRVTRKLAAVDKSPPVLLKAMSVVVDGATLAVAFDWLMEPVAVKLGFWSWGAAGGIPLYNYICWLLVSMLLLTVFHFCRFKKENKFAVNLLLIQSLFFLILRTFLK